MVPRAGLGWHRVEAWALKFSGTNRGEPHTWRGALGRVNRALPRLRVDPLRFADIGVSRALGYRDIGEPVWIKAVLVVGWGISAGWVCGSGCWPERWACIPHYELGSMTSAPRTPAPPASALRRPPVIRL
ncbi:hypothetical protein GCM10028790_26330 [Micromonospora taraxaci]